jgi:DNA polymerase I
MNNIFTKGHIVWLFSRDSNKELQVKKITNFRPYFYVSDKEGTYETIFGDKCSKVMVSTPYDVAKERDTYEKTFEADIHYPNRFIIDYFDKIPDNPLRYQFIDLEMATKTKALPDIKNPEDPVISICVWDSFIKKYYIFCWNKNIKLDTRVTDKYEVIYCSAEQEMVDFFIEFQKEMTPDMMCAWNGAAFDFPYMFNRFSVDKLKQISAINKAGFDGRRNYIAGISLMDYMDMYKNITVPLGGKESYALDYIGKIELGTGKKKIGWINYDMWNNNFEEILEYTLRDVEIMVNLNKKLRIVEYFNALRQATYSRFEDVFHNSILVDDMLLSFSKGKYILPTKKKNIKEKFKAGYVKTPEKGLHEWVAAFDATSLYPSIIRTFNISKECISSDGEINIDGVRFRKEPLGIYPKTCTYMTNERNKFRDERDKYEIGSEEYDTFEMQSQSAKFVNNSIYGNSAYPGSRLYSVDVARSITYVAREFTKWVASLAEKLGYRFLYADTDSVWIILKGTNTKECIKEGREFQKYVNSRIIEFVKQFGVEKHYLELKFEKIFSKAFFTKKKRYCGRMLWKEGLNCNKDEFKGFEVKRSDTPEIGKQFQKVVLTMVLDGKPKQEIDVYVKEFIKKIKTIEIDKVGFPVGTKPLDQYKSIPIHIRAMLYSIDNGLDVFYPGEKIKYIFIRKVPKNYPKTNVLAFKDNFPDGFELDYDRITERIVWKKLNPIYKALGWISDKTKKENLTLVNLY